MFFLSLLVASLAAAEPVISLESTLDLPIEQRVRVFRSLPVKSYAFLSKVAFDRRENLETRWRAIISMGRVDAARFRPQLDRALHSPEWFIRNAALIALLSDEHGRAVAGSFALLEDPALVVRTQAVRNLIALNARESEPKLWQLINDRRNFRGRESLWIRAHLAEALAKFAGPGRVKAFGRLLMDEDPRLHKWAIEGLETSSGLRLSDRHEAIEVRRQQWLARLGVQEM